MAEKKVLLYAHSSAEMKKLERISENIAKKLQGREVKKGDKIDIAGIKLHTGYTAPEDKIKIDSGTEIEICLKPENVDVLLALDTSYSMNKDDYRPTRFEAAKNALCTFLAQKIDTRDRVGIITFSHGYTVHMMPAVVDKNAISMVSAELESLKPGGRTALSNAIQGAIEVFGSQGMPENAKTLILLTDGCDNIGDVPREAALKAKEAGIQIYPVLIGGGTQYDENTMREIADITGGAFHPTTNENELVALCVEFGGKRATPTHIEARTEDTIIPEVKEVKKEEGKIVKLLKDLKKKVW